jgi:two-component system alkaline phosphatase synthesis response regulator PhoP
MNRENASIVIVDDDDAMRATARELLRAAGYDVRDARDPEDALVMIRHDPPDVAIVDLDIEKREGADLAAAISADPDLEDTALIGVSFDVARIDLERVDLAVQKPYATLDLPEVVRRVLEDLDEG